VPKILPISFSVNWPRTERKVVTKSSKAK
jgi:hypothetical protein